MINLVPILPDQNSANQNVCLSPCVFDLTFFVLFIRHMKSLVLSAYCSYIKLVSGHIEGHLLI